MPLDLIREERENHPIDEGAQGVGSSWWVKTSSLLHQLELAKAHLSVVDISLVEKTYSNKRIELSLSVGTTQPTPYPLQAPAPFLQKEKGDVNM